MGTAPTMASIKRDYGETTILAWLEAQLFDLSEFAGCKDKLSTRQISEIAILMFNKAYFLKVTEFMLFLSKLKSGEYGHFYGAVDGIRILEALGDFLTWRWNEKSRFEAIEEQKRKELEEAENKKHVVTWNEFKEKNGLTDDDFPLKPL